MTILVAEIHKLELDLDDAVWMLKQISDRVAQDALASHNYLINPADKTQIEKWLAERKARIRKIMGWKPEGTNA